MKSVDAQRNIVHIDGLKEAIVGENISVSYQEGGQPVLSGASFEIKKGKKYLVTGPSGSGKTTLLKLLGCYVEKSEGKITIDGTELESVDLEDLYRCMAYMSQQVFLFDDTIKNNICLFQKYPEERVKEVVEAAGLSDYVNSLQQGLEYRIQNNGQNISGGEKARIALARAWISGKELLLLDEPFANLDDATIAGIEKRLLESEMTVINVSHVINKDMLAKYDVIYRIKDKSIEKQPLFILSQS